MNIRSPFRTARRGFTLIELLLVIGIIAILASIVIVAINPTRQLGQARNAQRRSDVNTILNAVYQYAIDNNGNLPGNLSGTVLTDNTFYKVCKTTACTPYNGFAIMARSLTGSYIVNMPQDPSLASTGTGYTGYLLMRDSNKRITVKPSTAEAGVAADTLAVTR